MRELATVSKNLFFFGSQVFVDDSGHYTPFTT